ncbi:hypothetical protein CC85DRAFT_10719 [Cutaneotrichosporon oleaginosum]|uniref:Uncharacterized protein n=1 Tax=Cutaneotrichosporon oleaginosum TaxID=879819 RepID=A0A0J0XD15_9TREE|nr:uncharacterized protein CC85DRAFT_10719 [Cutaneotrichosporon oleaginosum]KLT38956.1 hypothetical protein CC85DRAFT_10719 [Cutaneotrichosporon oleaginosum]TXT07604.1 hypothetical protein COLE_04528 [Cutaneotrichosporon oleaginosum]
MFPLMPEPLAPARPEIAEAAPYTACGCVHHRQVQSAPTSPLPALRSPSQRSRLFAEASEARRRFNQCRDWASIVSGAARDAVHFNVVDHGSPYASGQRTLPAFYYDPDAHEPAALNPTQCGPGCTSSRRDKDTDTKPIAKRPGAGVSIKVEEHEEHEEHEEREEHEPTALGLRFRHYRPHGAEREYQYARIEVLDEKPRRLHVEPHLEGSALRKRRRSPHAAAAAASAPPAQRVKVEPPSPRRPSSVPAPARASGSRHDRRTEPHPRSRVSEPPRAHEHRQARQERDRRAHSPRPSPPRVQALPMRVVLSTQSAPDTTAGADADHGRAPDQDSPKRICDPLPSIGGLWCARDTRHHTSSHPPSSSKSNSRKAP